jgi:hypothetical protein
MRVVRQLSVLLSSTCVTLSIAAQTLSLPLQTDLSDRDLQILETLVETAQQNSGAVKEAKAELGISSWSDNS